MDNNMKSIKCLVIGAGPTGSMVACFLKRIYKERISLEVWDKSRGIGGRMSTSRYAADSSLSLDLGAQYISVTKEHKIKHGSLIDELVHNRILAPLNTATVVGIRGSEDTTHFVAPDGISSIPKYFIQQSGCTFRSSSTLNEVNVNKSVATACATNMVGNDHNNIRQEADCIVITMPIPQLFALKGDIATLLEPYKSKLNNVSYSLRYALGLFYPNLREVCDVGWSCNYIRDNPCLCFISMDTKKRERDSAEGLSVIAHASVPYSLEHVNDSFKDVERTMLDHIHNEIPGLPKVVDKTKIIRWRYSQVRYAYDGTPGHILLNDSPAVLCAGDGFSHSNFVGCAESALSVVDCFKTQFPLLE